MAGYQYHQYGDLPQIPSISEDSHFNHWTNNALGYRQTPVRVENDYGYSGLEENSGLEMHRMERFLVDASPLTTGLLQAKLHQGIPIASQRYQGYEPWPTADLVRYDSPGRTSDSATSISYATQNEVRSPHPYHANPYGTPEEPTQMAFGYPSSDHLKSEFSLSGGSISLRDIEYEHDPEPEMTVEEADTVDIKTDAVFQQDPVYLKVESASDNYRGYPESKVSSSPRDAESVQPMEASEGDSSDPDYLPKSNRRRRSSASNNNFGRNGQRRRSYHGRKNSTSSTPHVSKISKRGGRTTVAFTNKGAGDANGESRHFPCPLAAYGCRSTFASKNEWKRHVCTQHIKLGYWRCDLCATTVDSHDDQTVYYNDFNRKDLFTQHLRRMHAEPPSHSARNNKDYPVTEDNIAEHQKRCFQELRGTPTKSRCLYCEETFAGPNSWDLRMEHIGRHLEKERKAGLKIGDVASWNSDTELEQWLLDEGIIAFHGGQWRIGDGKPKRHLHVGEDEESEQES